jgi:glycosyltransferase involved in cell wall biosynthesis
MKKQLRAIPRKALANHNKPKVVAAIPCLDEERFIGAIVQQAKPWVAQVYVVDDGSSDQTAQVAESAGALVIRHRRNLGPGSATGTCFDLAREADADILVTLDGDGQHDPREIGIVLSPLLTEEADLVIGSRFLGTSLEMPNYRRFGIKVITWLCNLGATNKLTDAQSCFRAYGRQALSELRVTDTGFGFSVETLAFARRAGLRIVDAPISCAYHEQSSSLNPIRHGLTVALAVLKHRLRAVFVKPRYPLT